MIKPLSLEQEAEFKLDMRRLYKKIGFNGCCQVLYEFFKSAEWLSTVMLEEREKALKEKD